MRHEPVGEQRLELLVARLCHVIVASQQGSEKAPPVSAFLHRYWETKGGEGG